MTVYALSRSFLTTPGSEGRWVDVDMEWVDGTVLIVVTDDEEEVIRLAIPETRYIQEVKLMTERREREEETRNQT